MRLISQISFIYLNLIQVFTHIITYQEREKKTEKKNRYIPYTVKAWKKHKVFFKTSTISIIGTMQEQKQR